MYKPKLELKIAKDMFGEDSAYMKDAIVYVKDTFGIERKFSPTINLNNTREVADYYGIETLEEHPLKIYKPMWVATIVDNQYDIYQAYGEKWEDAICNTVENKINDK